MKSLIIGCFITILMLSGCSEDVDKKSVQLSAQELSILDSSDYDQYPNLSHFMDTRTFDEFDSNGDLIDKNVYDFLFLQKIDSDHDIQSYFSKMSEDLIYIDIYPCSASSKDFALGYIVKNNTNNTVTSYNYFFSPIDLLKFGVLDTGTDMCIKISEHVGSNSIVDPYDYTSNEMIIEISEIKDLLSERGL